MRTKYDQETKDRLIRMFYERRQEVPGESMRASFRHLHDLTGISPDTMRGWVDRARVDAREKPGVTSAEREEIRALRKELAELKRANEILKTAALRRISFACLSSRFSLSNALTRSRSASRARCSGISLRSTALTHLRRVSAVQPIFSATLTMAAHYDS